MRASVFVVSAFAAVVFGQDSSSVDAHPQTTFTTQTDSRGVVTGQPTIPGQPAQVTSQPAQVTTQPAVQTSVGVADSIPAVGTTGIHTVTIGHSDNTTSTLTVSANNSTTRVLTPTPSGPSGSGSNGASGSGAVSTGTDANGSPTTFTNTPSSTSANGAAAATMLGSLIGAGAFVAAFL